MKVTQNWSCVSYVTDEMKKEKEVSRSFLGSQGFTISFHSIFFVWLKGYNFDVLEVIYEIEKSSRTSQYFVNVCSTFTAMIIFLHEKNFFGTWAIYAHC